MARGLEQLPIELLLSIAHYLKSRRDINALVQTSKSLYRSSYRVLCLYNIRHEKGSALVWAAQNGYTKLTTNLLDAGLNIASFESPNEVVYDNTIIEDISKINPLLMAAQGGHIANLKLLLSETRSGQACSSAQLRTVFHWAIRSHKRDLVELIIQYKTPIDPAGQNREAPSALGVAVASRYDSIVPRLLDLGALPGENECPCPIDQAIYNNQPLLLQLLLEHGVQLNCDQSICYVASRGDKATLQLLIDYGIDLHLYGNAALLFAIKEGQYDVTELLLDSGANPNLYSQICEGHEHIFIYSAIGFAMHYDRLEILKLLLKKGVLPGFNDVAFNLHRFSKEALDILPKVSKDKLPPKEYLQGYLMLEEQIREESDPNFKMPHLIWSIDDGDFHFTRVAQGALEF